MDMECNIPEAIWQGKINNKRRCMYEILRWDLVAVPRDRYVLSQTWSCPTANKEAVQAAQETRHQTNSILRPITFARKSLSRVERRYSNIEREALGILHGLKKFCHYCFVREVRLITDHKWLVAIFKKDVATLSQRKQGVLFRIHQ